MNFYDVANDLAKAMRESHEYKKMKEASAKLNEDATAKKMVKEFIQLNQEAQIAQLSKKEVPAEMNEKIKKLHEVISLNYDAVQYLNAFVRFQMMLSDVTNNIQDVVKEAVGE